MLLCKVSLIVETSGSCETGTWNELNLTQIVFIGISVVANEAGTQSKKTAHSLKLLLKHVENCFKRRYQ